MSKRNTKGISGDSSSEYSVVPCQGDFSTFDEYTRIKTDVAPVINKLRTGLKNIINYNVDEISRYLPAGRIDSKSLSRMPSGAICAKRIEKNDEADLNITVLVDLSGSMNGYPIENAMKACVVLQEVCNSLKIPITVLSKRFRQRRKVDLPDPDAPIIQTTSPLLISMSIPFKTAVLPKSFFRSRT